MTKPLMSVHNLSVHYYARKDSIFGKREVIKAVDHINFQIFPNEIVGLVGESGSGKTTLGRALMNLLNPSNGEILFEGQNVADFTKSELLNFRKNVQMIFQDPFSALNPRIQVKSIISEPLLFHGLISSKQEEDMVSKLLKEVGLEPYFMHRYPHEMSGGQRQRVYIARILGLKPSLIIADEPVSALDNSVKNQVLSILSDLSKKYGISVLMISHDLDAVRQITGRTAVMYRGKIVEINLTHTLLNTPNHPYTKKLIGSIPIISL